MSLKNFMIESANILFDDSKNDLRALPKTVRLQILLVLSFIWSVVFSLYIFTYTTFIFGWAGVFLAHLGLIFAVYHTFKQFHKAEEKSASVFETKNFNPFKIMAIVFVIVLVKDLVLAFGDSLCDSNFSSDQLQQLSQPCHKSCLP